MQLACLPPDRISRALARVGPESMGHLVTICDIISQSELLEARRWSRGLAYRVLQYSGRSS